jgi:hypothetical protein
VLPRLPIAQPPTAAPDRKAPRSRKLPAWVGSDPRLCSLAQLEARQAEVPTFATGWPRFDEVLGGGFPRAQLSECSAPAASCGLSLLQHQLLLAARRQQQLVGLIDAFDRFDPASSDPALLDSLLWLRIQGNVAQAMKAADIVLRDENFGLILLDLREAAARDLRRIPAQQWYRLQRAAQEHQTTLLAFTPFPVAVSARLRLRFRAWNRPASPLPLDDLPRSLLVEAITANLQQESASLRQVG